MIESFGVLNYSGMLYNKANTKTPFLNMIGGNVKFTQSVEFVVGQSYTSEEGVIPSISETASATAPTATNVIRRQMSNVTQIFQEAISITFAKQSNMNTLSGVNIGGQSANPATELDFQVAQKMDKIKRSIEKTFIQGTYNKATADDEVNKTRGMVEAITTNVLTKTGTPTLSIWDVNTVQQSIYDSQGDISNLVLMVKPVQLNQLIADAIKYGFEMGSAYTSTYGIQIRELLLPLGIVRIALGEFLPDGTALLVNPSVIGPVEQPHPSRGNFYLHELGAKGAAESYEIVGQIGLDHGPEWYHGKITGLKTTFDAPNGVVDVNVVNPTTEPVNTKEVSA